MGWTVCVPFVTSSNILRIINTASIYECKPSDLLTISDDYVAFCFDEACGFILSKLRKGEDIHFEEEEKEQIQQPKTISEFYKELGVMN